MRTRLLLFGLMTAAVCSTAVLSLLILNNRPNHIIYRNTPTTSKPITIRDSNNSTVPDTIRSIIYADTNKHLYNMTSVNNSRSTATPLRNNTVVRNDTIDATEQRAIQLPLGPPISMPQNCEKPHCTEYLTRKDQSAMQSCRMAMDKYILKHKDVDLSVAEGNCSFMNGEHRLPIALASTEGSGNTWIRGLLEKVTGICTGFIWCDPIMWAHGFIGDNIKSGSVLVVKTHTIKPQWHTSVPRDMLKSFVSFEAFYGSAVFVLRNPRDALVADWNRRVTNGLVSKQPHMESHINVVGEEYWRGPKWDKFLHTYMKNWRNRLENWVITVHDKPIHVVRYEDLKANTFQEVKKLLDFIDITYKVDELERRLMEDYDHFKRQHQSDQFEHYSDEQKQHITSVLLETIETAKKHNSSKVLMSLEEYL